MWKYCTLHFSQEFHVKRAIRWISSEFHVKNILCETSVKTSHDDNLFASDSFTVKNIFTWISSEFCFRNFIWNCSYEFHVIFLWNSCETILLVSIQIFSLCEHYIEQTMLYSQSLDFAKISPYNAWYVQVLYGDIFALIEWTNNMEANVKIYIFTITFIVFILH